MDKYNLMIGNYLRDSHGRVVQVWEIKNHGVSCLYEGQQNTDMENVRQSYFPWTDLSPIEINPDVLAKFSGFSNKDYLPGYYGIEIKTNMYIDIPLKWEESKKHFVFSFRMGDLPLLTTFKYIHELQNFFMSLIKQPLPILGDPTSVHFFTQ